MNLKTLVPFLLLSAAVAGCVEEAAPPPIVDDAPIPSGSQAANATLDPGARPTWTHGDWFEFEVAIDNTYIVFETRDRVVVNRADATGYELGAGNRDLGVMDAHFDDFLVGLLDPNLNARLGEDEVDYRMFDWPLEPGKTWTAQLGTDPFTGQTDSVLLTASPLAKVKDPRGEAAGFMVEGVSELGFEVRYVYSARAKWITEFTKIAPDGRVAQSLLLKDFGANYQGVFHLVTKKDLLERVIIWPFFVFVPQLAPIPPVDLLTINEEFTFVQEIVAAFTFNIPQNGSQPEVQGAGSFQVHIQYPDNPAPRIVSHVGVGNDGQFESQDLEPYPKGQYVISHHGAGVGGTFIGYYGFDDEIIEFGAQSHEGH